MPRYNAKPSADERLASLCSASGSKSLTDPALARYLDANDSIGYMRYNYQIPTFTMMNLEAANPDDVENGSGEGDEQSGKQFRQDLAQQMNDGQQPPPQSNGTADAKDGASATRGLDLGDIGPKEPQDMIVYLAGNSLGLPSKQSLTRLQEEVAVWQCKAVTGWTDSQYGRPWASYAEKLAPMISGLVGAEPSEVASMGTLTANIHLLMCSFYRPTKDRYKILYEHKAFPSDNYAFASQAEMHGYSREEGLITMKPRDGEFTLRTQDILDVIEKEGDKVAVIFFSGVQFFTGQYFDIKTITEAGHKKGCLVGWDLAHGIGNVPVQLHDWNVDFAAWCTYKYLNSGPGGIAGLYVHTKHSKRPRLSGWWGNDLKTRFAMANEFDPAPGAAGFQTSTPSILTLASLLGSLESFLIMGKDESAQQESPPTTAVSLKKLRAKSVVITSYLAALFKSSEYFVPLKDLAAFEEAQKEKEQYKPGFTIITPDNEDERGAQLSVLLLPRNYGLLPVVAEALVSAGIHGDEREPDVIRFAPVPMYITYKECWITARAMNWVMENLARNIAKGQIPDRNKREHTPEPESQAHMPRSS